LFKITRSLAIHLKTFLILSATGAAKSLLKLIQMTQNSKHPQARTADLAQLQDEIADTSDRKRMLEMLLESSPPAADAPVPPLPEDLRRRLEERYGSPQPEVVPSRITQKPGGLASWVAWWQDFISHQKMALGGLAAAAALVLGFVFLQKPSQPMDEIMRGSGDPSVTAGPQFLWLADPTRNEIQLAVDAKVPGLASIPTLAEAQSISRDHTDAVILIDTAARAVIVMKNGVEIHREPIRTAMPPDVELDAILRALRAAERSLEL
jgi:hypothetical protein